MTKNKEVKYRIVQDDCRNDDTGFPVKRYYIEYLKTSFLTKKHYWRPYQYLVRYGMDVCMSMPTFNTLSEARKYVVGLKSPLIKKIIK